MKAKLLTFAVLGMLPVLAACSDKYENAFVARCEKVTGASSSACGCAAGKMKQAVDDKEWSIMGMIISGDKATAEVEAKKLGFGGMFGIMAHWTSAIAVAENQCPVSGLLRM